MGSGFDISGIDVDKTYLFFDLFFAGSPSASSTFATEVIIEDDYIFHNANRRIHKFNINGGFLLSTSIMNATTNEAGIDVDNDFIYWAPSYDGQYRLLKLNKSDLSLIAQSTQNTGLSYHIKTDNQYIYTGGSIIYKFDKNLILVGSSTNYSNTRNVLAQDELHLYIGGGSNGIWKIDKATMAVLGTIPIVIESIHIDGEFLYVGNSSGMISKYNKNTLSLEGSISLGVSATSYDITSDDYNIYVGIGTEIFALEKNTLVNITGAVTTNPTGNVRAMATNGKVLVANYVSATRSNIYSIAHKTK